jgi:TolB protein
MTEWQNEKRRPGVLRVGPSTCVALGSTILAMALAQPADAQQRDTIPGVELGIVYQTAAQPALAVKPFTGRAGGEGVAPRVEAILARDLRFSNRFTVMDSLPASLVGGEGVDYRLWDDLGAVWLVTGALEGSGDSGFSLTLELHDVVYREVKQRTRFAVPDPSDPDFRMAVHRAADDVVLQATGEKGIAATRIAFSQPRMVGGQEVQELWMVDSDGENLRRITNHESIVLSPAWSPDGRKIAFSSFRNGDQRIYELEVESGRERMVDPGRPGQHMTPSYSPDGKLLAMAVLGGDRSGIFTYDVERDCCATYLQGGRWNDLSPSWSPDGRRIVFNSNRLGTGTPQIYVMSSSGGEPDLVSPYRFGQPGYYTSPDWSPAGNRVAFHGRIGRGRYHILVADVEARGSRVAQLTFEGNNEDPSWAPDGRHIAFVGERSYGHGLFVVDTVTGRIRPVLMGLRARVPQWSPALAP